MDYQDAIERYTQGACHVFAVASVRKHGGRFLIVEDSEETWWEFDDDSVQDAVVHVYAVHDTPDGPIARDIRGDRPLDAVLEDVKAFFDVYEPYCRHDETLHDLMDLCDGDHERSTDMEPPLCGFDESDLKEAGKWVDWLPFIETPHRVSAEPLAEPTVEVSPAPAMMG